MLGMRGRGREIQWVGEVGYAWEEILGIKSALMIIIYYRHSLKLV